MLTPGAMIATDRGVCPAETLVRGQHLVTRCNGLARIEWVGRRTLSFAQLRQLPELGPVLIRAGSFGENCPRRDVLVSPEQRVLAAPGDTFLEMGRAPGLVAAKWLVDQRHVQRAPVLGVSYLLVLCDRSHVVLADGLWSELVHPDDRRSATANSQRREALSLFPDAETIAASRGQGGGGQIRPGGAGRALRG